MRIISAIFTLLVISGCTSNNNSLKLSGEVIPFDDIPKEKFCNSKVFERIVYLPLETNDSCILSDGLQLKTIGKDYYILDNKAHHVILRFAADGTFLNTIGRRGKGPNEYIHVIDFTVDKKHRTIELLTAPKFSIFNYTPDGQLLLTIKPEIPAQSIAKINEMYYLNIGYSNYFSKERIYRVTDAGKVISKYHPIKTKLFTLSEPNFFQTDSSVIFHESLCNTIYDVTTENIHPLYTFDFRKYNIPDIIHEMDPMEVLEMLNNKGIRTIISYLENKNFAYFLINQQQTSELSLNHLLIDKKTGHMKILTIPQNDEAFVAFGRAEMLTDSDELVFLVHQAFLSDLIVKYPFFKGNLVDQLNADLNPFIAKMKLRSF